MPPLDPIVSLTVAIAEALGSHAFLLGSGVSRDAGVPTGSEVFWLAVGELYRLERSVEETPSEDELAAWLNETERTDLNYSGVLELLTPDAATRRDYLAKHFEGREPAEAHERLAELVARGLIKVLVTTNFDRLLETALRARGIEPVVVTSDADLAAAPRREHSDCYVLKPHGDYLQQTIRNTPAELAELEPGIAAELQEIFDRYGVVVVGYSGGDEAVGEALRRRRSRYGLYWVARGELGEPARTIVEAVAGRVIVREGAAAFLADLDRRLAVFEAQPSGQTPVTVNDEVLALLRRGDDVGLRELLRGEGREFAERLTGLIERRRQESPNGAIAREVHDELVPVLERRLASLLPLALYAPDLFDDEVAALADLKGRQPALAGHSFWPDVFDWAVWWLVYAVGGFAARQRRFTTLRTLLELNASTRYGSKEPLAQPVSGDGGGHIGAAVMAQYSNDRWLDPAWEALVRELKHSALLAERYPELVTGDEPLRSLVEFDFVNSIARGLRDERAVARWTMVHSPAEEFARQLRDDARLRGMVAEAVGLTLEDFDAQAADAARKAYRLGQFPSAAAADILEPPARGPTSEPEVEQGR